MFVINILGLLWFTWILLRYKNTKNLKYMSSTKTDCGENTQAVWNSINWNCKHLPLLLLEAYQQISHLMISDFFHVYHMHLVQDIRQLFWTHSVICFPVSYEWQTNHVNCKHKQHKAHNCNVLATVNYYIYYNWNNKNIFRFMKGIKFCVLYITGSSNYTTAFRSNEMERQFN